MRGASIRTVDNGPLLVKGRVTLIDAGGGPYPTENESIALCRRGASANTPCCGGIHSSSGPRAAGRATDQRIRELPSPI